VLPPSNEAPALFDIRGLPPAEAATRLFLADTQLRVHSGAEDARQEATTLLQRETTIFRTSIVTGVIGIGLVLGGVLLVVLNYVAFALVSESVGLLAGGGTFGFRLAAKQANLRREALSERESIEGNVLRAVGVTMMIPDDQDRNAAMVDLAARLVEGVGTRPAKSR
jgi:tetrahydromethanopterin S-methyltransferase subunit F